MKEVEFDRFFVEEEDFSLYTKIEEDGVIPFKKHPEIFMLSACIGYKYGKRESLNKKKELSQKTSFLNLDDAHTIYNAFKLMANKNGELDPDGNIKVNTIIEEYAKGGFRKLVNEILSEYPDKTESLINYMLLNL